MAKEEALRLEAKVVEARPNAIDAALLAPSGSGQSQSQSQSFQPMK